MALKENIPDDVETCSINELIAWVRSKRYGNNSMILARMTNEVERLNVLVERMHPCHVCEDGCEGCKCSRVHDYEAITKTNGDRVFNVVAENERLNDEVSRLTKLLKDANINPQKAEDRNEAAEFYDSIRQELEGD